MKRIKLLAMITIISILFIMIAPKAYAVDESFQLQLEASSITLHPGDTFSVDIIIDNINITSGDQGTGAYQAKIVYDTKVLELVSVTPATGWEVLENEGNMVANTSNAEVVRERAHTAVINFKVLDDPNMGNSEISLESIQGSSGTTTIDGTVRQELVNIVENNTGNDNTTGGDNTTGDDNTIGNDNTTGDDNTAGNDNTTGNDNTGGGSNTNRNQIGGTSNINSNSNTTANKILPYAGFRNVIIIAIAVAIIVSIVFYIKYRRAV